MCAAVGKIPEPGKDITHEVAYNCGDYDQEKGIAKGKLSNAVLEVHEM